MAQQDYWSQFEPATDSAKQPDYWNQFEPAVPAEKPAAKPVSSRQPLTTALRTGPIDLTKREVHTKPDLPLQLSDPRKIPYGGPATTEKPPVITAEKTWEALNRPMVDNTTLQRMQEFTKEHPVFGTAGQMAAEQLTPLAGFLSPVFEGAAAMKMLPGAGMTPTYPALRSLGKVAGPAFGAPMIYHGATMPREELDAPGGTTRSLLNIGLGMLGMYGGLRGESRTTPPKVGGGGTDPTPPVVSKRGYGASSTGLESRSPLIPSARDYFPPTPAIDSALAARTGTGTPDTLMPGRVIPPTGTIEQPAVPLIAQQTPTATPDTLRAPRVPYQVDAPPTQPTPEIPITGTGSPEDILPGAGGFKAGGTGTGGWDSITATIPADKPIPPVSEVPAITADKPSGKLGVLDRMSQTDLRKRLSYLNKLPDTDLTTELAQEAVDIARKLGIDKDTMLSTVWDTVKAKLERAKKSETGALTPFGDPEAEAWLRELDELHNRRASILEYRRMLQKIEPNHPSLMRASTRESIINDLNSVINLRIQSTPLPVDNPDVPEPYDTGSMAMKPPPRREPVKIEGPSILGDWKSRWDYQNLIESAKSLGLNADDFDSPAALREAIESSQRPASEADWDQAKAASNQRLSDVNRPISREQELYNLLDLEYELGSDGNRINQIDKLIREIGVENISHELEYQIRQWEDQINLPSSVFEDVKPPIDEGPRQGNLSISGDKIVERYDPIQSLRDMLEGNMDAEQVRGALQLGEEHYNNLPSDLKVQFDQFRNEINRGRRERFGEEPPDTADARQKLRPRANYETVRRDRAAYEQHWRSVPAEERARLAKEGQQVPDFSKTQGVASNRKVWVENYSRDREGNKVGAYVSEAELNALAQQHKMRQSLGKPAETVIPTAEEQPIADLGTLREEIEKPLVTNKPLTEPSTERILGDVFPTTSERFAEIARLKKKVKDKVATGQDVKDLQKLEGMMRGRREIPTNEAERAAELEAKGNIEYDPTRQARDQPLAQPTTEPTKPPETPKLTEQIQKKKTLREERTNPSAPVGDDPVDQTVIKWAAALPTTTDDPKLAAAVKRLQQHLTADKPKPLQGYGVLNEDFRTLRDNPDTPPEIRSIVLDWMANGGRKLNQLLDHFFRDSSEPGTTLGMGFDPLSTIGDILRRKRAQQAVAESRLPPGWSTSSGRTSVSRGTGRPAPKSATAKPSVEHIRQIPRSENFGSDVDLGGLDTHKPEGMLGKLYDLPRNLMGFDPAVTSAAIRQVFTQVGTRAWRKALMASFRAWGEAGTLDLIHKTILSDPMAQPVRDASGKIIRNSPLKEMGIRFSNLSSHNAMAELIRGEFGRKIPLFARSNRAFTAFLNTSKFELAKQGWKGIPGIQNDLPMQKLFGDFVNNATGSGGLGKHGDKVADGLSKIFFAPRLVASRFHMMRQLVNPKLPWQIRKQYMKSAMIGTGTMVGLGLAAERLVPGITVSKDPTNPDFMKLKYKNKTRIDLGGGFQQLAVLAWKIAKLKSTSSTTGEAHNLNAGNPNWTWQGEVGKSALNKLHPSARLMVDLVPHMYKFLNSEAKSGSDLHVPDRLLQMVVPLNIQAAIEAYNESSDLQEALTIGGLGLLGVPVQSYEKGDEYGEPVMWPPKSLKDYDYVLEGSDSDSGARPLQP